MFPRRYFSPRYWAECYWSNGASAQTGKICGKVVNQPLLSGWVDLKPQLCGKVSAAPQISGTVKLTCCE